MEVGHQHQLFREVLLLLLSSPTADQDCAQPVIQLFQALGRKRLRQFRLQHPDDLAEELEDCGRLFEVKGNGVVTPKTSLTICRLHSNESGSCPENTCPDLHLCAFFLLSGQCAFGSHCLFGHELRTAHNRKLLERHLLAGLPITELRTLFCLPSVRQGVTLPKVCRFYNKIRGCSRGADCHSLHLCSYYVTGDCKFGKRCERNHNIDDPQVTRVMSLYGVKVNRNLSEVLQEVRMYNRRNEQEKDLHGMEFNGRSPHRRGARTRYGSVPTPCRGFSMAPSPQHDVHQRRGTTEQHQDDRYWPVVRAQSPVAPLSWNRSHHHHQQQWQQQNNHHDQQQQWQQQQQQLEYGYRPSSSVSRGRVSSYSPPPPMYGRHLTMPTRAASISQHYDIPSYF